MPEKTNDNSIVLDYITTMLSFPEYDEDGEVHNIPSYARLDDIIIEFGLDEDEVIDVAKENSFLIFDVKSEYAEGYYIADPKLDLEQFKKDYESVYGIKPEIEIIFNPEEVEVKDEIKVEEPAKEEPIEEDTVKQGNHWVNKGKEGTHGKFKTKKAADAQRKAMFANGYKENYPDGDIIYWCVSDGLNPRRSRIFNNEEVALEIAKANPHYKYVDKYVNGNPTTIWKREEIIKESKEDSVVRWWKDVEAYNDSHNHKFSIDNGDYSDIDGMFAAMFDMLGALQYEEDSEAKKLLSRGKRIYNHYAISPFNEAVVKPARVEWCVMDKDGNNSFDCFNSEEEAIKYCKETPEAFSVVGVEYNEDGEEISAQTIFEKDWVDEKLSEAKLDSYNVGDEWDWQDGSFVIIEIVKDDNTYQIRTPGNNTEWVTKDELVKRIEGGRKVTDGKYPFPDVDSLNEDKKKVTSDEIEGFIENIYDLRKQSIAEEGEYGIGNLVFKEFRNLGYLDNLKDIRNQVKSQELSLEGLNEEVQQQPTDEDIAFLRNWLDLGKESYLKGFDADNQTAFIVFPKYVSLDDLNDESSIANYLKDKGFKVDIKKTDYTYKTVGSFNSREMRTRGKGYDRTLKDRVRMDVSWTPYPVDEAIDTAKYNTIDKLIQIRKDTKEDGTYSIDPQGNLTLEKLDDGFMVSFFRPEIDDDSIKLVLKTIGNKLGTPYLGIFENHPEISYKFDNEDKALEFAQLFNQESIWDNENHIVINNPKFDSNHKVNYHKAVSKLKKMLHVSKHNYEKPQNEAIKRRETVTLYYPNLEIDDGFKIDWEYEADKDLVEEFLIDTLIFSPEYQDMSEEEIAQYTKDNFDELVEKYDDIICEYFESDAIEDAEMNYKPEEPDYEPW